MNARRPSPGAVSHELKLAIVVAAFGFVGWATKVANDLGQIRGMIETRVTNVEVDVDRNSERIDRNSERIDRNSNRLSALEAQK